MPSLFACCFGQPPQIQHTIVVQCPEGKAVSYFPDEINVEGTAAVAVKGANVSVNANATAELKGGAMVNVQGALVKLN